MKISQPIRTLLEIMLAHKTILESWGTACVSIKEYSIDFIVNGLLYAGPVEIKAVKENSLEYTVKIGPTSINSVPINSLINTMDKAIECSDHYEEDLENWLKGVL